MASLGPNELTTFLELIVHISDEITYQVTHISWAILPNILKK